MLKAFKHELNFMSELRVKNKLSFQSACNVQHNIQTADDLYQKIANVKFWCPHFDYDFRDLSVNLGTPSVI
jgi:hypothetical protein